MERVAAFGAEAGAVLQAYYEAVRVVRRDDAAAMVRLLGDTASGMWLARLGPELAGCVVLKAGVPFPLAGECKRLFVHPRFRRRGIAEALMDCLERSAAAAGFGWVYLDTNAAFAASVALYARRGYVPCARYNDNPQATMFLRKRL